MNIPLLGDVLLLAILGLMGIHAWTLHRRQKLRLLDPLFAFWAGIIMIYIRQPLSYSRILIQWHGEGIFLATLGWTLMGLAFVVIGYESKLGIYLGNKLPSAPTPLSPGKLSVAGYGLVALGGLGYLYLFASAGGMEEWLSIPRGGTDYDNISGYIGELSDLLPLGVILLLFQIHFHQTPSLKRILIWVLAAFMWWWFLYLGSRSRLIGLSLVALAACYLPRGKSPPVLLAAGVFIILIILSNFQERYRDNFSGLSLHLEQLDSREALGSVLPPLMGGDSSLQEEAVAPGMEFNCVMTVVELVPRSVPYNYGYGHLELFTRWIPRALWPDKIYPQMESIQGVLRDGQLSDSNVPGTDILMGPALTFVGHWFYVAGPFGLAFGGVLTGTLFQMIRTLYDRAPRSEGNILIYVSLIGIGFTEAAATPLAWIETLPFTLGPLIMILYFCRTSAPSVRTRLSPSIPTLELGHE